MENIKIFRNYSKAIANQTSTTTRVVAELALSMYQYRFANHRVNVRKITISSSHRIYQTHLSTQSSSDYAPFVDVFYLRKYEK